MQTENEDIQIPNASATEKDFEQQVASAKDNQDFTGDSEYDSQTDISPKFEEEQDLTQAEIERFNDENETSAGFSFRGIRKDDMDNDLDIPGAEMDDADEEIGHEDEENNYYSIGGDNHNDLEENKGD
jgi:hypothetical protein